jgi:hypothetical protein
MLRSDWEIPLLRSIFFDVLCGTAFRDTSSAERGSAKLANHIFRTNPLVKLFSGHIT